MIDSVGRFASALGVRPLAERGYGLLKDVEYRLHGETYTVKVGNASAEFYIPTKNEFSDFDELEERPILESLLGELRPEDVFYDVGANVGLYANLAADVVENPVVAFEPHPKNADRLAQNAARNDADVSVFRSALAGEDGRAELEISLEKVGSAGHSLVRTPENANRRAIQIEKYCGDDFIAAKGLPEPTVLKIDVEGTEYSVLEGLEETLSRRACRLVYCEVHPERLQLTGRSVEELREKLERHGFTVENKSIRSGQPFLRAEKQ